LRLLGARPVAQFLAVLLFAVLIGSPCLIRGIPDGGDSRTHVNYQYHFDAQRAGGEHYPRWLADANRGAGGPVFVIQYPLPYFAANALGTLISAAPNDRPARSLGLYLALCVMVAAVGTWMWLRQIVSGEAAAVAALTYVSMPYLLDVALYHRAAIGELGALALLPCALGCCEAMRSHRFAIAGLAVVVAMIFLANLLNAIMFLPLIALYGLACGVDRGVPLIAAIGQPVAAITLGAALAAVYLVPFFLGRENFLDDQLPALLSSFELGRYFLFLTEGSLSQSGFLLTVALVSTLALAGAGYAWRVERQMAARILLATLLAATVLALTPDIGPQMIRTAGWQVHSFEERGFFSQRLLVTTLSTVTLGVVAFAASSGIRQWRGTILAVFAWGSFLIMLPVAAWIWRVLPAAESFQFPFRFSALLCATVVGLVALALDRALGDRSSSGRSRARWISGAAVAMIVLGLWVWRVDWQVLGRQVISYDTARNVDINFPMYVDANAVQAFAADMATTDSPYAPHGDGAEADLRWGLSCGAGQISVSRVDSRTLAIAANTPAPACLWIGQTYTPQWRVEGKEATSISLRPSPRGTIELTLPARPVALLLKYDGQFAETLGRNISLAALALLSVLVFFKTLRRTT
jgi:hypothetical protein